MKLLSKENVNNGRQPEIDIVKAIAIIFMIIIHTYQGCNGGCEGLGISFLGYFAGFFGAGSFMICMGIGMRYARNHTPKDYIIRGLALLTVSQLVNLLRLSIPSLVLYEATDKTFNLGYVLDVIQTDILTFAGLAFLLMAALTALRLKDECIFAIGLVLNFLMVPCAAFIPHIESFWTDRLLSLLIATDSALFPICTHFIYVSFGYLMGGLYMRIEDKKHLAGRVLLFCLPIVVIYYALRMSFPFPLMAEYIPEDEPSLGTDALAVCLDTVILLALCYKFTERNGLKAPSFMNHLSKYINSYYCVSEVILGIIVAIRFLIDSDGIKSTAILYLCSFLLIILCFLIIEINARYIHFTIAGLKGTKAIIVYTSIWAATFVIVAYAMSEISDFSVIYSFYN